MKNKILLYTSGGDTWSRTSNFINTKKNDLEGSSVLFLEKLKIQMYKEKKIRENDFNVILIIILKIFFLKFESNLNGWMELQSKLNKLYAIAI